MCPHDRLQIPGDSFVLHSQTQEVQKHVNEFTTIALRGGAVVIQILGVMIDQGLIDKRHPTIRFGDRQEPAFQVFHQTCISKMVFTLFHGTGKPLSDPLMQNRTDVAQLQKHLGEHGIAIILDKRNQNFPFPRVRHDFQG